MVHTTALTATFINFLLLASVTAFIPPFSADNSFPYSPWAFFQNLSGCNPGDHNPLLPNLKSYLHRFGYLPLPLPSFSDLFDGNLTDALLSYQRNLGLPLTGFLDQATLSVLSRPRCGVADIITANSTIRGRNLYSYFSGTPSWPAEKSTLTYALKETSSISIDRLTLLAIFASAFSRWSAATMLNFTQALPDSDDPDITIGFYKGDHGDNEEFDGVLGTLAHAFSPTDGRFHLDAAEEWVVGGDVTVKGDENAVDLESVAVHEIGHLLGMGHSPVVEAVMYPSIGTRTRKVELSRDDVEGIQRLYGGNPNYKVGSRGSSSQETSGGGSVVAAWWTVTIATATAVALFVWSSKISA